MRYKACTAEDIAFLKTRISSDLNSQKDEINQLGSERFAAETNQQLRHFFSVDMIPSKEPEDEHRGRKDFVGKKHGVRTQNSSLENYLYASECLS